jgi:hypothetical protein
MVDLFDPELIAAQKKYAADLLGHVNAYTHNAYAVEPAVAIVEINKENSMFMWNADRTLAELPSPYAEELAKQWNQWLTKKYPTAVGLPVPSAGPRCSSVSQETISRSRGAPKMFGSNR